MSEKRSNPGGDLRLPTIGELWESYVKERQANWLWPRFDELLKDARLFREEMESSTDAVIQARYARATVVFSSATIEAASNDALVTINDLMRCTWPAEEIDEPPWVYFRRLSRDRPRRLLKSGSLRQKIKYVLARLEKGIGWIPEDLNGRLLLMAKIRNRILHMRSLSKPRHLPSVMNSKQIRYVAKIAVTTADEYTVLLRQGLDWMKLPMERFKG